jgi:hypothetical protein
LKQDIAIGIFVLIAIAVLIGVKTWLHNLLKFKMDESAILQFLEASGSDYKFLSTEAISAATDIDMTRISSVCAKSKSIMRNDKEGESWCVKQQAKL